MRMKRLISPVLANARTGRLIAKLTGDRIRHRGLIIDTSHPVITPEIKAALFWHGYESGEYRFIRRHLPRDLDVIELGGSMGVISATIRRHIELGRKLVIVEADPRLADVLETNLTNNRCADGVTIERTAISYSGDASVSFALGPSSVSGRLADNSRADEQTVTVPAVTLSGLVQRHGFSRFSLVCDIEGVEWDILAQDQGVLAQAEVVIMELHARPGLETISAQVDRLLGLGLFELIDQHGPVVALRRKG
jgi:FkbM family methyltransferase